MDSAASELVLRHLENSRCALEDVCSHSEFTSSVIAIAKTITSALKSGCKLLLAGNGGSAGDAQHLAGEFLSRLNYDRAPLPAMVLTTDLSVLTAMGNDYGYEQVFERQIRSLGRAGDVFIAISTSGHSPNIVRALMAARTLGVTTVGMTGRTKVATPLIQQIYVVAAHAICSLVEHALFRHFA